MRKNNVVLRLQSSLLDEAKRVSASEGVALNQFINVAVAEKLSALRTGAGRVDLRKVARFSNAPAKATDPFRATKSKAVLV